MADYTPSEVLVTRTWNWNEISGVLPGIDLVATMEAAFVALSDGGAVIPRVAELQFKQPPGDVHIKYGYLRSGKHYVVKVASGFYDNPKQGLPSSNGLMLLFDQQTGAPVAVLLDQGRLTDLRTAAAGAVAAKHLGPEQVTGIGIVGTGIQAREQLRALATVVTCRSVMVWGRSAEGTDSYVAEMSGEGWQVEVAPSLPILLGGSNLVVTCTPATAPLISRNNVRPGTHITAVGSDTAEKQELQTAVLAAADVVVGDSLAQCWVRGEISRALNARVMSDDKPVELGDVIAGRAKGRERPEDITVVDLTGVAVQDLAIAEAVHKALSGIDP